MGGRRARPLCTHRAASGDAPTRRQLLRLAVGRIERQRRAQRRVAVVQPSGCVVYLGQLAPHRNGLGRIELRHRLGQQRDVPGIARRRLQRRLQLQQREPRVAPCDVRRGQLARDAEIGGAMEQQALGDAHEVVGPSLRLQLHRELGQLVDRLIDQADQRRRLGQPNARRDVVRVQPDDLAQRGQRLLDLSRLLQLVRGRDPYRDNCFEVEAFAKARQP